MNQPAKLVVTPDQLNRHVTQIIAETCNCTGAWVQHPGPLTQNEIDEIRTRIAGLDGLLGRLTPGITDELRAKAPYPFCHERLMQSCVDNGRCMKEHVCND